ncbi:MAG: glycosyltransferase family 4 protein, partial [Candidatus Uhrbacteria bacterium]|nr:glycosyltransferase family 4 protein [Candidatus Uhrbacteria bacterium]
KMLVSSFDYARHSSLQPWFTANPSRVREIPFGVDLDSFSPGPDARHRFQLPIGAPTLLFVGGLDQAHAFKGLTDLFQAFCRLDSAAHLLIVGDGDLKFTYEERTRVLGIASRVHFLGRVDDETLRDAYRGSDVLVLPSTNTAEAFSLVALEAGACGTPVIASDLPGVRTVVRHGETGLLVPPKDHAALVSALERLLSDRDLRQTLGRAAHDFVTKNFSWDKHVDELIEVYQEVCALRF